MLDRLRNTALLACVSSTTIPPEWEDKAHRRRSRRRCNGVVHAMTAALARVGGRIRLHTPQAPSPPSVGQPCRQWGALW